VNQVPDTASEHLHGKANEASIVASFLVVLSVEGSWFFLLLPAVIQVGKPVWASWMRLYELKNVKLDGIHVVLLFDELYDDHLTNDWSRSLSDFILSILFFLVESQYFCLEDLSHSTFGELPKVFILSISTVDYLVA